MANIIACPHCHQDVLLPYEAPEHLECPHCQGYFSRQQVEGTTRQRGESDRPIDFGNRNQRRPVQPEVPTEEPPEAEVIKPPTQQPSPTSYNRPVMIDPPPTSQADNPPPDYDGLPDYARPDYATSDYSATEEPSADYPAADYPEANDPGSPDSETDYNNYANSSAGSDHQEPEVPEGFDLRSEESEPAAAGAEAEVAEEPADEQGAAAFMGAAAASEPVFTGGGVSVATGESGSSAARSSRRRRGPSVLVNMVGIVVSGVIGLGIGYYILNWYWGPQLNFLNLSLPGLKAPPAEAQDPLASTSPPRDARPGSGLPLGGSQPRRNSGGGGSEVAPFPQHMANSVDPAPARPALPVYSSDELGVAIREAHGAVGCEACNSEGFITRVVVTGTTQTPDGKVTEQKATKIEPCEVCQGKPTSGKITADVFKSLCHLSEMMTWVDMNDSRLNARREGIRNVLSRASERPEQVTSIGRQAGQLLATPQHRQFQGVLLAGTVDGMTEEDGVFLTRLILFGAPKEVVVASRQPAPFALRDRVLVAGSLIQDPTEVIEGYTGKLKQVVWGGYPFKLADTPR